MFIYRADPLWAVNTPTFVVGDRDNVLALVHFLCGLFIINGSYGIVVWTSMKIYKQLKAMRPRMSKETLEAQKQVTKILFIQVGVKTNCTDQVNSAMPVGCFSIRAR